MPPGCAGLAGGGLGAEELAEGRLGAVQLAAARDEVLGKVTNE